MIKVKQKVEIIRGHAGRKRITHASRTQAAAPAGRIPRVSKLMALAIRFDELLRSGVVSDQSELARLAQVTQPRMTQIMNLLHLASDIQEQILFLPPVISGNDAIHEKLLRPVVAQNDWARQRQLWGNLNRPQGG
jgi:hypothetical protein